MKLKSLLVNKITIKCIEKYIIKTCLFVFSFIYLSSCSSNIETGYIDYEKQLEINSSNENFNFNPENYLYRIINNNVPNFKLKEYDGKSFDRKI